MRIHTGDHILIADVHSEAVAVSDCSTAPTRPIENHTENAAQPPKHDDSTAATQRPTHHAALDESVSASDLPGRVPAR